MEGFFKSIKDKKTIYVCDIPYYTRARTSEEPHISEDQIRRIYLTCYEGTLIHIVSVVRYKIALEDKNVFMTKEKFIEIPKKIYIKKLIKTIFSTEEKIVTGMSDEFQYFDVAIKNINNTNIN